MSLPFSFTLSSNNPRDCSEKGVLDSGSAVLSFEEFKKALGLASNKYTDAQIDKMRLICDRIADAAFDDWLDKRNA